MANLTNQLGFVTNPQFSGGEAVTPLSGSEFAWQNRGYGGLYIGTPGTLVVKTINGNVLTLVSASGFIPGLIGAVSASSTAANIIGFDPIPVALPTTTTSTSTTSTSTSTSTSTTSTSTSTTAAPTTTSTTTLPIYLFQMGVAEFGTEPSACTLAIAGTFTPVYASAPVLANGVNVYYDAARTNPIPNNYIITIGNGNPQWIIGSGANIVGNVGTCTAPTTTSTSTSTTTAAP